MGELDVAGARCEAVGLNGGGRSAGHRIIDVRLDRLGAQHHDQVRGRAQQQPPGPGPRAPCDYGLRHRIPTLSTVLFRTTKMYEPLFPGEPILVEVSLGGNISSCVTLSEGMPQ